MNYYKRHLGDYAKDAGHLTMLEHGAYTLLLDRYYTTDSPIPKSEIYRIARARSKEERAATDAVVSEFFTEVNGSFVNGRADEEIANWREQAETNRKIAERREATKRARINNGSYHESCTNRSTNGQPSHKPLAISQEEAKEKNTSCSSPQASPADDKTQNPPAKIGERTSAITIDAVNAYNAILGKPNGRLSAVHLANEVRQGQVKRCLPVARQICEKLGQPLDGVFWENYFAECDRDPFKRGDGPYTGTHANWRPDFEYLTRKDVMTVVFDKAMDRVESAA